MGRRGKKTLSKSDKTKERAPPVDPQTFPDEQSNVPSSRSRTCDRDANISLPGSSTSSSRISLTEALSKVM